MLKAAVIGTGNMGRNHLRVYRELAGVDLVGVADENPVTVREVATSFGVRSYTDYRELLVKEKPHLASIAVPTARHFEFARELIERGVHVLVEKPIASTVEEGEQLVDLAHSNSVILGVGHIERFNPAIVELRRLLSKGIGGRVYQIHARRQSPVPARSRDADVIIDLATHDIDLMRHLVQEPIQRVYAETLRSVDSDREDLFAGTIRFRSGVLGVLDVNWLTPAKIRLLTVTAARGLFQCDLLSQSLVFNAHDGPPLPEGLGGVAHTRTNHVYDIVIERREPLVTELSNFVEAVRNHRSPAVDGRDGLETLRVARALLESGKQTAVVRDFEHSTV